MSESGIEIMRRAVELFDACDESFLEGFNYDELLAILAYHDDHDEVPEYPDSWSQETIEAALASRRKEPRALDELKSSLESAKSRIAELETALSRLADAVSDGDPDDAALDLAERLLGEKQ